MLNQLIRFLQIITAFVFMSLVSVAQTPVCPTIVQEAINAMDNACSATERNQACYGNGQIDLTAQPNAMLAPFEAPGDQVTVSDIQTMTLYPLDERFNLWGVALMRLQADLPDTVPGQNVTILIFGDTEITNTSQNMEAFYFRGGVGEADCAQAPNGIMIQTPEGEGMINLTINNVRISLGSTAFVTAEAEDNLTFYLLEGEAEVTADDVTQMLVGGEQVNVPLDEDLQASGAPSEPDAIDFASLPILPISALPIDISELVPDLPSDASSASADGVIIPLSGNWHYQAGDVVVGGSCPPEFSAMAGFMPVTETSFVDFGGEPIDLESLFEDDGELVIDYFNPEPNIYMAGFSEEGIGFTYQLEVLSETAIIGYVLFDLSMPGMACTLTVDFEVTLMD